MAKFKLNSRVKTIISNAKNEGGKLNDKYKKPDKGSVIKGLKTINKFLAEEEDIYSMLNKYIQLINKDMNDAKAMLLKIENTDRNIAKSIKSAIGAATAATAAQISGHSGQGFSSGGGRF